MQKKFTYRYNLRRSFRRLRRERRQFFKRNVWRTRIIFWGGAVIVGVVAAMFAIMGETADNFFRNLVEDHPWYPLIITPLAFVVIVYLTRVVFPGSEGSGIPQTIVALDRRGGIELRKNLLSIRTAFGKVILTIMGLFSGASIGREGPTVHLGAAVIYTLGRYAHLPARYLERGLILTGGSAGIAAAFNTPLAGIMFAIEELARSFDRRNSSMILVGVIIAGMVAYFAGVVQTPLTAFIIVMEMTDNQDLVLALMATALIASGTSKLICRKPIYTALAENFLAVREHTEKDSRRSGSQL